METQEEVHVDTPFEPTAEQVQRAAALRRFNLLFVYIPFGLVGAAVLGLLVLMLIKAINQSDADALRLISGIADVALIIAVLPMLVVGAAIVAGLGFALSKGKKSAPIGKTQRLLWRLDNQIGRLRVQIQSTSGVVVRPFQSVNGAITYVVVLMDRLIKMVKRS